MPFERTNNKLGEGLFCASCLIFIFSAALASAEGRLSDSKGPVVITSASLTADNKAQTALFEGSVVARSDNMTIYSDSMLVYYAENGKISKIEAGGHIKLLRGGTVITSDAATYLSGEEKIIFSGSPKAIEGNRVISGTKMIYLLKEERSIVENSRVHIENTLLPGH